MYKISFALQLMLFILHLTPSSSFYVLILLKARKFQESLMTFSLAFSSWDVKLHGVIISLLISWWIDVASHSGDCDNVASVYVSCLLSVLCFVIQVTIQPLMQITEFPRVIKCYKTLSSDISLGGRKEQGNLFVCLFHWLRTFNILSAEWSEQEKTCEA